MDEQTIIDASVKSDGPILCTAWDCIGRYSLAIDNTHLIRISGGRTLYEDASLAKTENSVRLARLAMAPLTRSIVMLIRKLGWNWCRLRRRLMDNTRKSLTCVGRAEAAWIIDAGSSTGRTRGFGPRSKGMNRSLKE